MAKKETKPAAKNERAGNAGVDREPTIQAEPKKSFAERTNSGAPYLDKDGNENRGDVVEKKAKVVKPTE